MNTYKLVFVNPGPQPVVLEFTQDDIKNFDIIFQSNFSTFPIISDEIPTDQIAAQVLISFTGRNENFMKIISFFQSLNNLETFSEVIIYKNDRLICDLKKVLGISSRSSLLDQSDASDGEFNLIIVEGV